MEEGQVNLTAAALANQAAVDQCIRSYSHL